MPKKLKADTEEVHGMFGCLGFFVFSIVGWAIYNQLCFGTFFVVPQNWAELKSVAIPVFIVGASAFYVIGWILRLFAAEAKTVCEKCKTDQHSEFVKEEAIQVGSMVQRELHREAFRDPAGRPLAYKDEYRDVERPVFRNQYRWRCKKCGFQWTRNSPP